MIDVVIKLYETVSTSSPAANILVDESAQRLKLADFGAAALTNNISSDGLKDLGTLTYNPPEVGALLGRKLYKVVEIFV